MLGHTLLVTVVAFFLRYDGGAFSDCYEIPDGVF